MTKRQTKRKHGQRTYRKPSDPSLVQLGLLDRGIIGYIKKAFRI